MSKPTRRRASRLPRERREADILAAAARVFRLRGYEAASISEIAEGAGVVEGSIYRYFKNKRELLTKVIEQWYETMLAEADVDPGPGVPTRDRLCQVIRHHLRAIHEEPALSRLVFNEYRTDPDYRTTMIFRLNRRYTARAVDIIRQAIASGECRADLPLTLVRNLIYGGIEHHTWAFLRGEGDFSEEETARQIADLVYRGLAANPQPVPTPLSATVDRLHAAVARLDAILPTEAEPPAKRRRR